jgi:hypothetical protein
MVFVIIETDISCQIQFARITESYSRASEVVLPEYLYCSHVAGFWICVYVHSSVGGDAPLWEIYAMWKNMIFI